jgi:hypothetical protein
MEHSKTLTESDPLELDDAPSQDRPKIRKCLRCATEFESAWAGERICKRCKSSNSWKSNSY